MADHWERGDPKLGQLSLFDALADFIQSGESSADDDALKHLSEVQKLHREFQEVKRRQTEALQRRQRERQELRKRQLEEARQAQEAANQLRAERERRRQEEAERQAVRLLDDEKKRREELDRHVARVTSMDLPTDWTSAFADDERVFGVYVDSPADGLIKSITELGRVDIEYISRISSYSVPDTLAALRGSIYQNPDTWGECFYKGWETSDEYLSGNLMRKFKTAQKANARYNGYFQANLDAIESVLPVPPAFDEIYVTLGSPWVPPDVIDSFITHLFGPPHNWQGANNIQSFFTRYESATGAWSVPLKQRYGKSPKVERTYGTKRINALHILERTLNMRTIALYDTRKVFADGKFRDAKVLNKEETVAAGEKQKRLISEFRTWVWSDAERRERLTSIYVEKFGGVRRRVFNGDFLTLPGLKAELYDYQRAAVARILLTPSTLLAHDVGAGKTYIMAAAGMELRRMGISKKNIYVVPNNIIGQWSGIFKELYPDANVYTVTPRDFVPKKRRAVLASIRDGDFDAVIMAYSSFELIRLSPGLRKRELERELDELTASAPPGMPQFAPVTSERMKARCKKLQTEIKKLGQEIEKNQIEKNQDEASDGEPKIYFEELGVNTIFLDEAHNYKNVSIDSKADILGINKTGSAKCDEMLAKVRFVQRENDGRGAVFATGTPITNSVTDIFTMQRYLQSGELRFLDLEHFDNWAMTFGERVTEFEIDVDTTTYRLATRFSKFHNLPELTALLAQVSDFHSVYLGDLPENEGYTDGLIEQTPPLREYIQQLSKRADAVRRRLVSRKEDNMLKITTDGRKAALDIRLADPNGSFYKDSKAFACAGRVYSLYRETSDKLLTQLIFCDSSTPKAAFNMYGELKRLLTSFGVPESEIEFVHDHDTDKRREELFEKMRTGEVRILLGSTFKLGIGVNVQRKLVAVHHLDIPWRPSDMVQREGRMLRQGNENNSVKIFRYITKGSFDAYSWQLLETKQRFISQLLSGSVTSRDASDVDDVVLSYAEVKALAIGNPLIKQRVETANTLNQAMLLQRRLSDTIASMRQELAALPAKIRAHREFIEKARRDAEHFRENKLEIADMNGHRELGQTILDAARGYELRPETKYLLTYQGMRVVLPENMPPDRPAVWLENAGRYYTELGTSDIGSITRIDNRLNSLETMVEDRERIVDNSERRSRELEAAIENAEQSREEYAVKTAELTERLAALDKKLGVDENAAKKK